MEGSSCAFKHASKGFLNTIILKNPMVFKYSWRNVGNVMSTDVFTVSAEASVREAASAMVEHDIGSVVVVEGKAPRRRVKGLVTDHSLLRLLAERQDPAKVPVKGVMTPDPVTVHPREDFMVASALMESYKVKKLPVVEGGYLVGIITQSDVAHVVNELNKQYSFRLSTMDRPLRKNAGKQG